MRQLKTHSIIGVLGGLLYLGIELLWRGHTHWTMFVLGGVCFVLLGLLNEVLPWEMPLWLQMACGALVVTAAELVAGLVLNVWLGLAIWDYSTMPLNLWGQICVPYMVLWFALALPAIVFEDYLHYRLCGERMPHYYLLHTPKRGVGS